MSGSSVFSGILKFPEVHAETSAVDAGICGNWGQEEAAVFFWETKMSNAVSQKDENTQRQIKKKIFLKFADCGVHEVTVAGGFSFIVQYL